MGDVDEDVVVVGLLALIDNLPLRIPHEIVLAARFESEATRLRLPLFSEILMHPVDIDQHHHMALRNCCSHRRVYFPVVAINNGKSFIVTHLRTSKFEREK